MAWDSSLFVTRDIFLLLGMAAAGLADVIDVRVMMLCSALLTLATRALSAVMPGLGQPAAEWKRAMSLLRAAPAAPGLGVGRAATLADFDVLAGRLPSLAGLAPKARQALIAQARVTQAPPGTTVIRRGDTGDAAYFLGGARCGGDCDRGRRVSLPFGLDSRRFLWRDCGADGRAAHTHRICRAWLDSIRGRCATCAHPSLCCTLELWAGAGTVILPYREAVT